VPSLLRHGPFRFWIVMADCDEREHVHVSSGGGGAKL
jgi:hypothetical protein